MASQPRAAARYHGDQAAVPGMLDFAVNVRAWEPPLWLVDRLIARMADLGRYPSTADEHRARHAVAPRHGRSVDDVALLRSLTKTWALAGLTSIGLDVIDGCAPLVLFSVPDAQLMRKHLDGKGIVVRRCDTFVGFDGDFLRAAVRPHWPVLVDAIAESAAMSGLREERVAS